MLVYTSHIIISLSLTRFWRELNPVFSFAHGVRRLERIYFINTCFRIFQRHKGNGALPQTDQVRLIAIEHLYMELGDYYEYALCWPSRLGDTRRKIKEEGYSPSWKCPPGVNLACCVTHLFLWKFYTRWGIGLWHSTIWLPSLPSDCYSVFNDWSLQNLWNRHSNDKKLKGTTVNMQCNLLYKSTVSMHCKSVTRLYCIA